MRLVSAVRPLVSRAIAAAVLALVGTGASACDPEAKQKTSRPPVPEACVTLGACCETLPEPELGACFQERDAAASSDTGSVPCSRALATYRGRGFCGGKTDPGKVLAPGCALLSACCASMADEGERAACQVDLEAFSASREGEEGCVASHAERVERGLCEEAPPIERGPRCTELLACCASLAEDARTACTQSAEQLATRPTAEDDCASSFAAYRKAGLCVDL